MLTWSWNTNKQHSPLWYIIGATVVISFALWGFFLQLYAMTFVVVIFAGVYLLIENNSADIQQISFEDSGVALDEVLYEFPTIASFSIVHSGKTPLFLRLQLKKGMLTVLDIPLPEDIRTADIRAAFSQKVEEVAEVQVGLVEGLLYWLKI